MGLIYEDVNIVNLDGTLLEQDKILQESKTILNMQEICPVSIMSPVKQFELAGSILDSLPQGISLLGSGDYHHFSLHLIRKIKKPVTLFVFDNHSDNYPAPPGFITCGSWINEVSKIENVNRVFVIGVRHGAPKSSKNFSGKIVTLPYSRVGGGDRNRLKNNFSGRFKNIVAWALDNTKTDNVYISIDKDVLGQGQAYTGWDQGKMTLEQLLGAISLILSGKTVTGVDICGEWKIGREAVFINFLERNHILVNQQANLAILDTLLRQKKGC